LECSVCVETRANENDQIREYSDDRDGPAADLLFDREDNADKRHDDGYGFDRIHERPNVAEIILSTISFSQ
jgi:hypothetical protein